MGIGGKALLVVSTWLSRPSGPISSFPPAARVGPLGRAALAPDAFYTTQGVRRGIGHRTTERDAPVAPARTDVLRIRVSPVRGLTRACRLRCLRKLEESGYVIHMHAS